MNILYYSCKTIYYIIVARQGTVANYRVVDTDYTSYAILYNIIYYNIN